MEIVSDLLKIIVPAALVLYAMYLTVSAFIKKSIEERQLAVNQQNVAVVLPIRLQAYERICLFLERISPNNLLLRISGNAAHVLEFQQILLQEIRNEFNHNLSQQVYMTSQAWEHVRNAQQNVITLINQASAEVAPEAAPIELSKKIFEKIVQNNQNPTAEALFFVKNEIQKTFV